MTPITIYSEKYTLDMTVTVMSDKPFAQSPMPLWVLKVVQWALQAVVYVLIAYFVIQAIQAVVSSIFVKTQTVKIYNPDGTLREETTTSEPSWTSGILVVGGLAIVAFIVVPVLLDRLKGRKKRAATRRRTKK
jgi:TRAP-type C4-dicarboxylate transport system permease small subunit